MLTHGKNKDHRPDLKQLVLGLNVTADGAVPISHRIYAGNRTDDRLHPANHKALQKLLQRVDFIYVVVGIAVQAVDTFDDFIRASPRYVLRR